MARRLRKFDTAHALLYPIVTSACLYLSQRDARRNDHPTCRAKIRIVHKLRGRTRMNLVVWLPLLFVLGLAGMGVCGWFLLGCERI